MADISSVFNQQTAAPPTQPDFNTWEYFSKNYLQPNTLTPALGNTEINSDFSPTMWQRFTGWTDPTSHIKTLGMASPLVNLAQTGINAYLGLKNLSVAEDTLDFQKDAFSKQFEIQRKNINRQLRDRQARRIEAAGPNAGLPSVEEYMKLNAV